MSDTMLPNSGLHADALLNQMGLPATPCVKRIFDLSNIQTAQFYPCGFDSGYVPTVTGMSISAGAVTAHAVPCRAIIGHGMAGNTITAQVNARGLGDLVLYSPTHLHFASLAIGRLEKIHRDLERLRDGWAGAGTKAPSLQTLTDFERLMSALPSDIRLPEVEVDDETGYVTLRWSSPSLGLSFVLRGTGKALLVTTAVGEPTVVSSQTFDLDADTHGIARYLTTDPDYRAALEAA